MTPQEKLAALAEKWRKEGNGLFNDPTSEVRNERGRALLDCADELTTLLSEHGGGGECNEIDRTRFRKAPCYLCGYNGEGYYSPSSHPCAAKYHRAPPPQPASLNEPFGDTEQLPEDAPFPEGWDEGRKYRCVRTGRQPPSEGELLADLDLVWNSVSDGKEERAAYERLKARLAASGQGVEGWTIQVKRGGPDDERGIWAVDSEGSSIWLAAASTQEKGNG